MMNIQPANKISEETLLLFRKVLEDDLKSYAIKISNEQNIDIKNIPNPMPDKNVINLSLILQLQNVV